MAILKFGKYKGQDIADVAKTNDGLQYLQWLSENTDVKDPKYGKSNQALLDDINKNMEGKTIYLEERKGFKKKSGGGISPEVIKKLDDIASDLKIIKQKLGCKSTDEVLVGDDEIPF
jgi:uncharacterized protein (DUF3820 family)